MSNGVAVVVIHGMGSQDPNFAESMIKEVNSRVTDSGKNASNIAWQPIFWADILSKKQENYLQRAIKAGDMDGIALRRFMLSAFGDASAYRKIPGSKNTTYKKIHSRIKSLINGLYENQLGSSPRPMIIMAHSLGGHIMSNYIWDMQQAKNAPNAFERLEYLSGMITFGCNIPLFTFAHHKVVPITFPPTPRPAGLPSTSLWLNYYDPDDVLAYPLRAINKDYKNTVTADIDINVGGLLSFWNPLSHAGYWTDNDFTRPVADQISDFL